MSNLNIPPAIWLAAEFEFEYCADCGGDACHHTAIPVLGNWFARCDFPRSDDEHATLHPAIQQYHLANGNEHVTHSHL